MITTAIRQLYPSDLDSWKDLYTGETHADHLISRVLSDFDTFGSKFIDYFERIISHGELPKSTTRDRLKARYLQTYNDYWAPLGEVAAQRQIRPYRVLLDEATQVADDYLKKLGLNLPGALVYFNKATSIKYFPYTDIAFIGTPYTQVITKDWMAIPHELGHYLYWNLGSTLKATRAEHERLLQRAESVLEATETMKAWRSRPELAKVPIRKLILPWFEEAFADVVGVLLAEEEFLHSLETLIKNSAGNLEELLEQDGTHVPLSLRPFLRGHAYKIIKKESNTKIWRDFFKDNYEIPDIRKVKIRFNRPDIDQIIENMSQVSLLALLKDNKEVIETVIPPIEHSIAAFFPLQEALVEMLVDEIQEIIKKGLPARQKPTAAFDSMVALAEEETGRTGQQAYEIILRPAILEGGDQHGPHTAWSTHGAHTVPVHNH